MIYYTFANFIIIVIYDCKQETQILAKARGVLPAGIRDI